MQNIGLRTPGVLSVVFGAQGAFLLANAVYTLAYPSAASNLPDSPLAGVPSHTVQCLGLTSLSTGTIYAIASYQRNIPIMVASLPGRFFAGATLVEPFPSHGRFNLATRLEEKGDHAPRSLVTMG
ncbi:hypothetical protein N7471_005179 [Penicillium samsonianum]|uniref:uncharacterized protein n=1 Tax=Penicillium samsonianum TaxID=1882272 RepID=UPI0025473CE6|nr:uncharacterized protein N7471_005179 [Penicillium samsonianum]KAJ6138693.1 hypothetical protein N7471_005179 [Penicillium samsonianum]